MELEKQRNLFKQDSDNVEDLIDAQIGLLNVKTEASNNERELLRRTNTLIKRYAEEQSQLTNDTLINKIDSTYQEAELDTELHKILTRNSDDYYNHIKEKDQEDYDNLIKKEEQKKAIIQASFDFAQSLLNQIAAIQQRNNEQEMSNLDAKYQAEIKKAGKNEKEKAKIDAKYDKEKRELQRKQAQQSKNLALFQAIIGGAQAIINGLNTTPFMPLGILMGALAGIMAGLQIGYIASEPLPALAKGTKSAKGGRALIGEAGRELAVDPLGNLVMFDKPTVANLKPHTRVFNNKETEEIIAATKGY